MKVKNEEETNSFRNICVARDHRGDEYLCYNKLRPWPICVLPGTQPVAAKRFDQVIITGLLESGGIKKGRDRPVTPSSLEIR